MVITVYWSPPGAAEGALRRRPDGGWVTDRRIRTARTARHVRQVGAPSGDPDPFVPPVSPARTAGPGRAVIAARPYDLSARRPDPPTNAPPTLSLVISRKARRRAAAAARASSTVDPRLVVIGRVLTGFQIAGNVLALVLSAAGWAWIAAHRTRPTTSDPLVGHGTQAVGPALLRPLTSVSGTALVLVMLATCLLMAPSVNPFYVPPADRRRLHTGRTITFAVLAVSTVAVLTGAAATG